VVAVSALAAGCGTRPAPQLGAAREIRGVVAVEPPASPRPYAAADLAFGLDVLGPPVVFNRPYLLLVSATGTGEPLFLARVANPDEP
jgi:hypothetical protein